MKIKISITLKDGVLDPQGQAIEKALKTLQFCNLKNVKQGKLIELELDENNPQEAKKIAEKMCTKLLANLIIENYFIELS